jgi:hypothetical protein
MNYLRQYPNRGIIDGARQWAIARKLKRGKEDRACTCWARNNDLRDVSHIRGAGCSVSRRCKLIGNIVALIEESVAMANENRFKNYALKPYRETARHGAPSVDRRFGLSMK